MDKNNDKFITMEDIDALTEKELKVVRQLMPMGADTEEGDLPDLPPEDDGDGASEGDSYEAEGPFDDDLPADDDTPAEGEGKTADNDIGDGFPEDEQSGSGDFSKEGLHTEL